MSNTVTLGRSGITVNRNGFGALPIQRDTFEVAEHIVRRAYENGITYFDSARAYADSERKLGNALHNVRDKVIIATKTMAKTVEDFWKDLETSLSELQTDYIDVYQFHNPPFCPKPNDGTGLYEAMLEAKAQGKILHIGISNHRMDVATEAVTSGLYETLQYPFSYLATQRDIDLVNLCKEHNVGFVAMKSLSGGLINRADAAYAFASQFTNVVPIWGIQHEHELDEFLSFDKNPPALDDEMKALIESDQKTLGVNFCRGCGYCMPCTMDIEINNCNRMIWFLQRSNVSEYTTPAWHEKMNKIADCIECGQCLPRCPYNLDIPAQLKMNLEFFREFTSKM